MVVGRPNAERLPRILDAAGVKPLFSAAAPDGRPVDNVETYVFENGALTIVGLQRDYVSAPPPRNREGFVIELPKRFSVYDVRAQRALGITDRVQFELDPVEPLLLMTSEQPIGPPSIDGPPSAHRGDIVELRLASGSPAARAVLRLDVLDPDGVTAAHYSGNVIGQGMSASKLFPIALNDKTGIWKLRATDLFSGRSTARELQVGP